MSKTESYNPLSLDIDTKNSLDFVNIFLEIDKDVHKALHAASNDIAKALDLIKNHFAKHTQARLIYLGAGTSGRLGILDATECPPTFSTDPNMVLGIIAGGTKAITQAVEGAEDNWAEAFTTIDNLLTNQDVLVLISASGNAAYILGAIEAAKKKSSLIIGITNNKEAKLIKEVEHSIILDTGPELISGSTRLKAGTSQKIVLNILSTGLMVSLSKVYSNLMVDLKASNSKLKRRAIELTSFVAKCDQEKAQEALKLCEQKVKNAILVITKNIDYPQSIELLAKHKGSLRACLENS